MAFLTPLTFIYKMRTKIAMKSLTKLIYTNFNFTT